MRGVGLLKTVMIGDIEFLMIYFGAIAHIGASEKMGFTGGSAMKYGGLVKESG